MNIKEIFIKWEKLRIVYNLMLLLILVIMLLNAYYFNEHGAPEVPFISVAFLSFVMGVIANILYFAGPIVESYISWLGPKPKYFTRILFSSGLLLSVALEFAFLTLELSPF